MQDVKDQAARFSVGSWPAFGLSGRSPSIHLRAVIKLARMAVVRPPVSPAEESRRGGIGQHTHGAHQVLGLSLKKLAAGVRPARHFGRIAVDTSPEFGISWCLDLVMTTRVRSPRAVGNALRTRKLRPKNRGVLGQPARRVKVL